MAEALGRLCHAASSSAKSSRPASPRGTPPHPHPHPASTSGSSSSIQHAVGADAVKGPHTATRPVSTTQRPCPHMGSANDSNAAAAAAGKDEQSQSNAGGEETHGSAEDEQSHRSEEGEGTPATASGVEEGAVGGAASMLAALQRLEAQPDGASDLRGKSQAESSMHSSGATQEASNTQHQSLPGHLGQSEGEGPSVHSIGAQEPAAATAVAAESEEQAGSGTAEASGSPKAASAGSHAIPSLVVSQVGRPEFRVCILLQVNGASHCTENNKHNITVTLTIWCTTVCKEAFSDTGMLCDHFLGHCLVFIRKQQSKW